MEEEGAQQWKSDEMSPAVRRWRRFVVVVAVAVAVIAVRPRRRSSVEAVAESTRPATLDEPGWEPHEPLQAVRPGRRRTTTTATTNDDGGGDDDDARTSRSS